MIGLTEGGLLREKIGLQRRVTRIAAIGVALLVGAGCADQGGEMAAGGGFCAGILERMDTFLAGFNPPTDERYGGAVVVGGGGELAGGMNALVTETEGSWEHQAFLNLMTLVQWDEDLSGPTPYMARDWDFRPEEGTLTFYLRDDIWWHDGVKTTAEDVAFTYRRATDPDGAFANPAFWEFYERGDAGVEVLDSFTVRFHLKDHVEPLDVWRATPILPAHLLQDVPWEELIGHPYGTQCPVGNGPFRFISHDQDEQWTFDANPAFPAELGGRPLIDRYQFRIIPDPNALTTALLTGEIDVYIQVNPQQVGRIEGSESATVGSFRSRGFDFIAWNARNELFADFRVRQALTLAIDRAEIIREIYSGYATAVEGSVPPGFWQSQAFEGLGSGYDPDSAAVLLAAAGWIDRDGDGVLENEDGLPFAGELLYLLGPQTYRDIAERVQARLRIVGVDMQPMGLSPSVVIPRITNAESRNFDAVVLSFTTDFRLDDRDLFHSQHHDVAYAFSGTSDAVLDHLLDTLQLVSERADAEPLWREYAERLVELQPYTFLASPQRFLGVRNGVHQVTGDSRGILVNVSRWWLDPGNR